MSGHSTTCHRNMNHSTLRLFVIRDCPHQPPNRLYGHWSAPLLLTLVINKITCFVCKSLESKLIEPCEERSTCTINLKFIFHGTTTDASSVATKPIPAMLRSFIWIFGINLCIWTLNLILTNKKEGPLGPLTVFWLSEACGSNQPWCHNRCRVTSDESKLAVEKRDSVRSTSPPTLPESSVSTSSPSTEAGRTALDVPIASAPGSPAYPTWSQLRLRHARCRPLELGIDVDIRTCNSSACSSGKSSNCCECGFSEHNSYL